MNPLAVLFEIRTLLEEVRDELRKLNKHFGA